MSPKDNILTVVGSAVAATIAFIYATLGDVPQTVLWGIVMLAPCYGFHKNKNLLKGNLFSHRLSCVIGLITVPLSMLSFLIKDYGLGFRCGLQALFCLMMFLLSED